MDYYGSLIGLIIMPFDVKKKRNDSSSLVAGNSLKVILVLSILPGHLLEMG